VVFYDIVRYRKLYDILHFFQNAITIVKMRKKHKFRVHDLSYDIVRYRTISSFFNENLWIGTPLYTSVKKYLAQNLF